MCFITDNVLCAAFLSSALPLPEAFFHQMISNNKACWVFSKFLLLDFKANADVL